MNSWKIIVFEWLFIVAMIILFKRRSDKKKMEKKGVQGITMDSEGNE